MQPGEDVGQEQQEASFERREQLLYFWQQRKKEFKLVRRNKRGIFLWHDPSGSSPSRKHASLQTAPNIWTETDLEPVSKVEASSPDGSRKLRVRQR